jgi:hypothetical protein
MMISKVSRRSILIPQGDVWDFRGAEQSNA